MNPHGNLNRGCASLVWLSQRPHAIVCLLECIPAAPPQHDPKAWPGDLSLAPHPAKHKPYTTTSCPQTQITPYSRKQPLPSPATTHNHEPPNNHPPHPRGNRRSPSRLSSGQHDHAHHADELHQRLHDRYRALHRVRPDALRHRFLDPDSHAAAAHRRLHSSSTRDVVTAITALDYKRAAGVFASDALYRGGVQAGDGWWACVGGFGVGAGFGVITDRLRIAG